MQQDNIALIRISPDQDGLIPFHERIEIQVEAELVTPEVGAAKMECSAQGRRRPGQGGSAFEGSNPIDVERTADVLGSMLATVNVSIVVLQLGHVANGLGDGDPAWFSEHLNSFGKVYTVAEDIVTGFVDDDLAKMDADAEYQPLLLGDVAIEACHALLDSDGCPDGGNCGLEFSQDGISRGVNQRAAGAFDGRLPD